MEIQASNFDFFFSVIILKNISSLIVCYVIAEFMKCWILKIVQKIFYLFLIGNARIVYERAVEFYGDDNMDESLFIAFARFEENQREVKYLFYVMFCIYLWNKFSKNSLIFQMQGTIWCVFGLFYLPLMTILVFLILVWESSSCLQICFG